MRTRRIPYHWVVLLLLITGQAWSQQLTQYSQLPFHQFSLNPALAGFNRCIEIRSLYRQQWLGIPQAPSGGFFTLSARLGRDKSRVVRSVHHGIGFRFEHDAYGPFRHNRVNLAYAMHIPIQKQLTLSMGLALGLDNLAYDATKVSSINPDPAVQQSQFSFMAPDAAFGAWLTGNSFFAGVTMQNLIPLDYGIGFESKKRFHLTVNGGMRIGLGGDNFSLLPVLLFRFPPRGPVGIDVHAMLDYRNILTFGVGYRRQESVLFLARVKFLGYFSLAYSFDLITNKLRGNMGHTHEISIGISTCKSKSTSSTICPIFE
jgi:type IX secretion system PorP/SprF family membrane protein